MLFSCKTVIYYRLSVGVCWSSNTKYRVMIRKRFRYYVNPFYIQGEECNVIVTLPIKVLVICTRYSIGSLDATFAFDARARKYIPFLKFDSSLI